MKMLEKLAKSSNKSVSKAASGAIWQMKNKRKEVTDGKATIIVQFKYDFELKSLKYLL